MIHPIQGAKTIGANAYDKVKNSSTKAKVAAAVGTTAAVGTVAYAYVKGKGVELPETKMPKTLNATKEGFKVIGGQIADAAIGAKDAVVKFFKGFGKKG